jgi:hypothetical protein
MRSKGRRTLILSVKPVLVLVYCLIITFSLTPRFFAQVTVENKIPKNAPVKIDVQNADSVDWFRDIRIQVTNVGNKPIRFLYVVLELDRNAENGIPWGVPFVFGSHNLYSKTELAKDEDPAILPREAYTFKIEEKQVLLWERQLERGNFVGNTDAKLRLCWLNFGDGTGLAGCTGLPFKKTF